METSFRSVLDELSAKKYAHLRGMMRDVPMRVLLLHNPKAGHGDHEAEELIDALKQAGHEPAYRSSKDKGIKKALSQEIDLVIAAGGDGLVGKVARRLIGRKIPLSVIPLGTANNLARTLGFTARPENLIAKLDTGQIQKFDVGFARGPWGKRYFFEGAGAGLFADYLQAPRDVVPTKERISKAEAMKRHIVELRRKLQDYEPQPWEIEVDGEDLSGRYFLWQAMNIRSIGPVLKLAPSAKTDDGQLDFIAAGEDDRTALLGYLDARLARTKRKFPLQTRKFTKMRLRCKNPLHFDDAIWPDEKEEQPGPCEIEITVRPAALTIWTTR
jgi:diacylglycerol kinase (ATP)